MTVAPVTTWRSLIWLLLALPAAIPLVAKLLSHGNPGGLSLSNAVLITGAFLLMPLIALFIVYLCARSHSGAQ